MNRRWLVGGAAMSLMAGWFGLFLPVGNAEPRDVSVPVIAPGAPTSLVQLARKHKFQPCVTPPKGMVCIPGGIYVQGSDRNAQSSSSVLRAESPRHYVILDTFYIDKYEVTHAQFKRCIQAGRCKPSRFRMYPGHWGYRRFGLPNKPFVSATWFHARDYCRFAGKRLLTEAEWEAAARGPQGYTYPWGNDKPSCRKANYRVFPPRWSYPNRATMRFCPPPWAKDRKPVPYRQDQTWPVGSTPAFRGIFDMAGNGYEWVQDVYDPHAYAGCGDPKHPCIRVNPTGPCKGKLRCKIKRKQIWIWRRVRATRSQSVHRAHKRRRWRWKRVLVKLRHPRTRLYTQHILKGGSWWWYADRLRAAYRRASRPDTGMHRLSIRCGSSTPTLRPLPPKPRRKLRRHRRR